MKKLLIVLFICLVFAGRGYAACTGSSPTWTTTPDYTSVSSCVSQATAGDTVNVSAGTANWSNRLLIDKSLIVTGAGIGNTVITWTGGNSQAIKYSTSSDSVFALSGFTLDCNNLSNSMYGLQIYNSSKTVTFKNLRVHHNRITNCGNGIYTLGTIFGVIDNNQMVGNKTVFRIFGNQSYSWDTEPLQLGTANSLYIEANILSGTTDETTLTGWGARWVFRKNTIDLTSSGYNVLDGHGNLPSAYPVCDPYSLRGNVGIEIYENTFTTINRTNASLMDMRGGTNIMFDNIGTGNPLKCGDMSIRVREEDANTVGGSCYPLKTTYPGYDPVKDTYIWNNVCEGTPLTFSNEDNNSLMIIEKQDYWADVLEWDGGPTTYFTKGLSSGRSGACTAQDVYWETDNKKLYRCTATNTWTLEYTPYTYPHPSIVSCTPAKVVYTTQPGGGAINSIWSQQPVVEVQDAGSNRCYYATDTIALVPSSGAIICNTEPLNAANGVVSFTGCYMATSGSGLTLTASSGALTPAVSSAFNITTPVSSRGLVIRTPVSRSQVNRSQVAR